MKLRPRDTFLSFMMLVIASGAGYMLYRELTRSGLSSGNQQVGVVAYHENVLQRRYQNDTRWERITRDTVLYDYDSIRTMKGSRADIKIQFVSDKTGSEYDSTLTLDENTFITLSFGSESSIQLESGSFNAEGALNIQTGDKVITTGDDGALNISKSLSGETNITVNTGEAEISSGGVSQTVAQNQQVELTQGTNAIRKKELRVVPKSPSQGDFFISMESGYPLDFTWDLLADVDALSLELSQSRNFDSPRRFTVSGEEQFTLDLEPGRYYWRLAAPVDNELEYSPVNSFNIVGEEPIYPISPANGIELTYRSRFPKVLFNCSPSRNAQRYRLEISDSKDFSTIAYSNENLNSPIFSYDQLGEGVWYWRMTPWIGMSQVGFANSTPVQSFSITQRTQSAAPQLLTPAEGAGFMIGLSGEDSTSGDYSGDRSIRFSWRKDPEIQRYRLTIWSEDESFEQPLLTRNLSLNYESLPLSELEIEGNWFWQVDGINPDQSLIPGSQTRRFSIERFSIELESLYPGDREVISLDNSRQVEFSWSSNVNKNFTLELYKDDINPPPLYSIPYITGKSSTLPLLSEGTYYWRVMYRDNRETIRSSLTRFDVFTPLTEPEILSPVPNQQVALSRDEGLLFRWKLIQNADFYQADLYEAGSGAPVLSKSSLADTRWRIEDISSLRKGDYRLTVKAAAAASSEGEFRYSPVGSVNFNISNVLIYNPPLPVSPADGAMISLDDIGNQGLVFRWQQKPQMESFYLDLATVADFSRIEQSLYSDSTMAAVRNLQPGEYYWRVRSYDSDDRDAPPSSISRFRVTPSSRKYPPILALPKSKASFSVKEQRSGIEFSWDGNEKYNSYRFQISAESAFNDPVINREVSAKRISLRGELALGRYYWRVGSVRADGQIDLFSEVRRVDIRELSGKISPIFPGPDSEIETDQYGSVEFRWASDFEGPFRFQLYNNRRPSIPISVLTSDSGELKTLLPGSGEYLWQVLYVDPQGAVYKTGEKYGFAAYRPLATPELISPLPNSEYLFKQQKSIEFLWEPVPEAGSYELSVINLDQNNTIAEESVDGVNFSLKRTDRLPAGAYRININAASETTGGSIRRSRENSLRFFITAPASAIAPELKKPQDKSIFRRLEIMNGGLDFSWSSTHSKANYWLEVATDSSFKNIYRYRKLTEAKSRFDDFEAGDYFWRVRVENPDDRSQINSAAQTFSVLPLPRLDAPVMAQPLDGSTVLMDYAESLDFIWSSVRGAQHYLLSCFSKNGDVIFENLKINSTSYSFKSLEKLDIGDFYCIIKAEGYEGVQKVEISSDEMRVDFSIALESEIFTPDILSPEIQYAD